jgi:hypothetical protein
MRVRGGHLIATTVAVWAASIGMATAQEHVTLRSDVLLYGDNTEFRNPFREGETIFGAAVWLFADVELSPRVSVALGGFGNERFGSARAFDLARPIVSMTTRSRHSSFTFGTLPAPTAEGAIGPDRMGPHGLLPPLQRETLAFERPYEAGLQWALTTARVRHTIWLSWQRLNTEDHRERFDSGLDAAVEANKTLSFPIQVHVVHEGGQLFASGAVADSVAAAAGVNVRVPMAHVDRFSIEVYGLVSRYVPDRSMSSLSRDGTAFFGRAAAERRGWRAHAIFWRGRNFIKDEGDPNYLSIARSGARYRGTRDYAELGLARRMFLARGAALEVSGRVHRVEHFYEYSYRVASIINLGWRIR